MNGGADLSADLSVDLSAVILTGGRSRRMASPKAWLPLSEVPLLLHVAARVRPLVREIVVVAAAHQDLPALEARVLRDPVPDLGPLPALALGLAAIATPYAFALGCDAPFVRRAVLRLLAREAAGADSAIPLWQGRPQPLVAVYHRRLADPLAALGKAGERRLGAVTALPGVHLVPEERLREADPEGASFRTLNTPAEYAAAIERWGRGTPED